MDAKSRDVWRLFRYAAIGLAFALAGAPRTASAQNADLDDLRARVERLEWENQQLRQSQAAPPDGNTASSPPPDARAIEAVDDPQINELDARSEHRKEQTDPVPLDPAPAIAGPPGAQASFKNGLFLWLESPKKDFTMHVGGWFQWDNVWWNQSPALQANPTTRPGNAQGVATGVTMGGIGDLQDGEYFRRIRPFVEGTFWENGEYRLILALENNQFSTTGLDEFWAAANNIPVIGTIRLGHVKDPLGLEGDMTGSSRCMTFLERSAYSEAIELNQNFVTGIWLANNYLEQRVTWQAAVFRPDQGASSGTFFGDGQSGVQLRVTGLPLYEDDGRYLMHLAVSGGWRDGTTNIASLAYKGRTIQLRARPELRDDDTAGSPPGNAQIVPNANSNRMVDSGVLASNNEFLMGLETLYIRGPLSFQAEYGWNWVNNAVGVVQNSTATGFVPLASPQDYMFSGGYVQLAYTLTGENRAYDKRTGILAREYFGKQGPADNARIARDADGTWILGRGAWEIACRYSYVNLNSGVGPERIEGGIMDGVGVALNWYLNSNMNVNLDWIYNDRYDVPDGTHPGHTNGFGTRVQFQF